MSRRRAVFLDRDGTLMEDVHYCSDAQKVNIYPGVPEALRKLKDAGFCTLIITNQSGIGRGLVTEVQYRSVQEELMRQIGEGLIDAAYYCADAPGVPSVRRKPELGMIIEAAADFDIDLAQSYFVGDKITDIECGRRAGMRTILVLTGHGADESSAASDFSATDISQAVDIILSIP